MAVADAKDLLGRPPLFFASTIAIPSAKILLQHGACLALAVRPMALITVSIAQSTLMVRLLKMAAKKHCHDPFIGEMVGHLARLPCKVKFARSERPP